MPMSLNAELELELKNRGADWLSFVDISHLSIDQTKGYRSAILIGLVLSPEYLQKVTDTSDYVREMIRCKRIHEDEFHLKELQADQLADYLAHYLTQKGYPAYSQSEDSIYLTGFYNEKTKSTPLPHKTIARLAGLGWIGKHNLLVTPEYGSAICMCTVLTDAPITTHSVEVPLSAQCGACGICQVICADHAIKGKAWDVTTSRDGVVDVYKCTTCFKCVVHCPWTQKYIRKNGGH
ncbi:MAG: epoxyqueuosine reductase [Marinilabiliaceae bacterium]|nr:epoxyqueuosine reductase [Marinilabiliaceae bacterium]